LIVLDQISASADVYEPTPIGAEFFGRARDLRRRIAAEDAQYDASVKELIEPIRDRLRRYPRRSPRPEMLAALVQSWRFMPCRDWRLDLSAKLDKHRVTLTERRLIASLLKPNDDPDWRGVEQDVGVVVVRMSVDRHRAELATRCVATLSLHALARRFQRGQDGDVAAVLHDINLAASAASGELTPGAGYRVRTDDQGGGWRGRAINHGLADGTSRVVLSIRTWLDR
jgi:hypothetical protein